MKPVITLPYSIFKPGLALLLASLLALALMLPLAGLAYADDPFIVNSTGDGGDANPGDGTCETGSGNGICTLRAAIEESNAATAITHTIAFSIAGAGPHTITPTSAFTDITHPVVIDGLTQPGASCESWPPTLLIEIDGSNVPAQVSAFPTGPSDLTPPIGLNLTAGNSTVRGLVINKFDKLANTGAPLNIDIDKVGVAIVVDTSDNNTIECNFLGTEPDGTTAAPNQVGISVGNGNNNVITGNLISGNGNGGSQTAGVIIGVEPVNGGESDGNRIINNRIGTDKNGTADVGNAQDGVLLVNVRNTVISGNLIAANGDDGIDITDVATVTFLSFDFAVACDTAPCATGNVIQYNTIGLDINGSILANGDSGVQIEDAEQNSVQFNTIAGNGKHGVEIDDQGIDSCTKGTSPCAISNTIHANSIYANTHLGIDLTGGPEDGSGVTANDSDDSDSGSNMLQNYPVLSSALTDTTTLSVSGVLTAAANSSFTIDLFANDTCDASGHGEGQTFLTSDTVTTNGSGRASFVIETTRPDSTQISATATDIGGNTSEFSECVTVSSEVQGLTLTISGGNNQSTLTNNVFAQPLTVSLTNSLDEPVGPGSVISFTAPTSGASISGPNVVTATTNSSGVASVTVTANGTPGSYQVMATAAGANSPAIFYLTNTLPLPDLAITKTVALSGATAAPGDPITYTIVVANHGLADATNVTVTDILPAAIEGLDLDETVTVTAGEALTFTINATISNDAGWGGFIPNTASYSHTSGTGSSMAGFTTLSDTTPPGDVTLFTPANGSTITQTQTISFSWSAASDDLSGLDYYTLKLTGDNSASLDSQASDSITTTQTSYTPTNLLANGVYTWTVQAQDKAGNISSSLPATFTVAIPDNTSSGQKVYLPVVIKDD
jgi:uncharacterized repeat protein (TIGR01451 family)/CSLREA domain-containing protein